MICPSNSGWGHRCELGKHQGGHRGEGARWADREGREWKSDGSGHEWEPGGHIYEQMVEG